jgi:hypothetical protein
MVALRTQALPALLGALALEISLGGSAAYATQREPSPRTAAAPRRLRPSRDARAFVAPEQSVATL